MIYPLDKEESWERCRWESKERQYIRFDVLSQIGDLRGKTILDIGCGDAELYFYLHKRFRINSYIGVDCNRDMVAKAFQRTRSGGVYEGTVADATPEARLWDFDYAFMSGVFNAESAEVENYVHYYLPQVYEKARLGVAVNFLNDEYPYRHLDFHMWSPSQMAAFATTFCDNVQIRKDYLDNDFTVYLRK